MAEARVGASFGLRVLVAEDEALCALELEALLQDWDCRVVGPVSNVEGIVASSEDADCALLDVNLRGETCYDVASELKRRGCPIAFVTGYSELPNCPDELSDTPRLEKPFSSEQVLALLRRLGEAAARRKAPKAG